MARLTLRFVRLRGGVAARGDISVDIRFLKAWRFAFGVLRSSKALYPHRRRLFLFIPGGAFDAASFSAFHLAILRARVAHGVRVAAGAA